MSNLRSWFSDQFGGIKEGLEKKSFIALILWNMDRRAGARGAFGRIESNYIARHYKIDPRPANNAARGPRPNTWWKKHRVLQAEDIFVGQACRIPPIFTR